MACIFNPRQAARAVIATSALAFIGAAALPALAQPRPVVTATVAPGYYGPPPPPRAERMPAPRRGYVWAPGHWEWRGNHHAWVGGHWLRARPGYAYVAPHWQQVGGQQWQYQPGYWTQARGPRDRDGDGVPDRYDRRPHDPHRR